MNAQELDGQAESQGHERAAQAAGPVRVAARRMRVEGWDSLSTAELWNAIMLTSQGVGEALGEYTELSDEGFRHSVQQDIDADAAYDLGRRRDAARDRLLALLEEAGF